MNNIIFLWIVLNSKRNSLLAINDSNILVRIIYYIFTTSLLLGDCDIY